jgi:hypothetical protein
MIHGSQNVFLVLTWVGGFSGFHELFRFWYHPICLKSTNTKDDNLYLRLRTMSHTICAAKFEHTIIHQHVHLRWESQSYAPAHVLMRLYPINKSLGPKLKYCLFVVSIPTQKNLRDSKDFIAVFKLLFFYFRNFRSVPCFSKVPVSGIFGILIVFQKNKIIYKKIWVGEWQANNFLI